MQVCSATAMIFFMAVLMKEEENYGRVVLFPVRFLLLSGLSLVFNLVILFCCQSCYESAG